MALCPNEWVITSFAIPNTPLPAGGGCHCSAVIESSDHFKCTLCSNQRRKPKGRRIVCPRSGSLRWWTNLSWWRWPSGTDRAAPGPSGTRSQRWTKPSLKLARKYDWRPEETVLSYVSLYYWALFNSWTFQNIDFATSVATLTCFKWPKERNPLVAVTPKLVL